MTQKNNFIHTITNEATATLPVIEFRGKIEVVERECDIETACEELAKQPLIGFDTETRPSFQAGVMYCVALLQLSTPERCFLFRLNKIPFARPIQKLLENEHILKVGADVGGDLRALRKLRHFRERGFIDLQSIAPQWGIDEKSLRKLSAIVLGKRVSKAQRLSNWEATVLTDKQQLYAATDAWVSIEIYNRLQHTPKMQNAKCKMQNAKFMTPRIFLRKGKEASLLRRHPWIFSGAIDYIEAEEQEQIAEGALVEVYTHAGDFIAQGHYQIGSIAVRVLSFEQEPIDQTWWNRRIATAYDVRQTLGLTDNAETNCYRLVHGEGDALSGLVVDIYGSTAVVQCHSVGMYHARLQIAEAIRAAYGARVEAIYDKSSQTVPFNAHLDPIDGYLWGTAHVPQTVVENGNRFLVNWEQGQKTGFFLDQRENRELVKRYAAGRKVLNTFCYTGGFSVYALAGGAERVVSVDSSERAVQLASENMQLNFGEAGNHSEVTADAMEYLKNSDNDYDLIILDPPAFAKRHTATRNALQGYKRLNARALSQIKAGGILFTFSCSQAVSREEFRLAVFSAAAIAGRKVRILHQLSQPADHPIDIYHPEGEYLKGLVVYVE